MKLCKDCRHVRHNGPLGPETIDPRCAKWLSPVDGQPYSAGIYRVDFEGFCGPLGAFWEPASTPTEEVEWRPSPWYARLWKRVSA
jgi:hypothetical protein